VHLFVVLVLESDPAIIALLYSFFFPEMQEALSEQTELTMDCKEEIQSALRERDSGSRVPLPGANADAMPIESRDNTAVYLVLFFVVLLVAGMFALCTFINQEKSKIPSQVDKSKGKGKKWQKKQAEKKARKEQNKKR
jgi:hypothetical protein|tara:strand:- start:253 stop:666 length:414 start_codon:yes stop_codon:yes gene_type:complete